MITNNISIDLQDVVKEFSLDENQAMQLSSFIIDKITQEYRLKWDFLIDTQLKKSKGEYKRARYITGIQTNGSSEVTFGLSARQSPLAMMIEEGYPPFDQKIGFKKSDKSKKKLDGGWYMTIPFRWATSEAVAESSIFAGALPKQIYDIAKKSSGPLQKNDLPEKYRTLGVRKEIRLPDLVVPEYVHKNPKYEGLVKIDVSTGNKKSNAYYTFRRVSDKSDVNSWWHKGFEAKKLMDKALEIAQIDKVTDIAIDKFLSDIL